MDVSLMSKDELKATCGELGLKKAGNKSALRARLRNYYKSSPENDVKSLADEEQLQDDVKPGDSVSNIASTANSARSQRAKIESLKVQRDMMAAEEDLKRQQAEIAAKLKQLELDKQIKILEAESDALSERTTSRSQRSKTKGYVPPIPIDDFVREKTAAATTKPDNDATQEVQTPHLIDQTCNTLAQQQMLDLLTLPKPQLMTFDGNPLNFHMFLNVFDSCIHAANISDAAKLNRLFEVCKEKPLRLIKACALMPPDQGYKQARKMLIERFGDDYEITEAHIKKIVAGPSVKSNNVASLQEFCDDVRSCTETLKAMGKISEVDTRSRLVKLVERLPFHLQNRWRREAVSERERSGTYPGIESFVKFLDDVTRELSDPVFGIKESTAPNPNRRVPNRNASFAVNVTPNTENKTTDKVQSSERRPAKCSVCAQDHPVYMCADFKKMPANERVKLASEKHLCYNCLKFGKHSAKECKSERVCNFHGCKLKHSYLLHDALTKTDAAPENQEKQKATSSSENTVKSFAVGSEYASKSKIALPIIQVQVHSPTSTINTYALLDPGSNQTFCSSELIEKLSVKGDRQTLSVNTIRGDDNIEATVVNLQVSGPDTESEIQSPLSLVTVLAVDEFPHLMSSITIKEEIQKYDHLRDLPAPTTVNNDVTLLIGQDNPHILAPLEVRRGSNKEPYAVKTALGWTINGPVDSKKNHQKNCFFLQNDTESLQQATEQFWKIDSYGSDKQSLLSQNDEKVLKDWEENVYMKDNHYHLSIPFKETDPQLPDNKPLAEKRLEYLGKRLKKDDRQLQRYKEEIDALIEKTYAEKVTDTENTVGQTWYIPHHAVFNINKPEKLRVVFDCSATYKNVSLNKSIHQGPDLTNSLIGVLLRFRENEYAIMSDVQAMFHQVAVPEKQRDALRFLWWQDGDPNKTTEVYRMTRHIFGGIWCSSAATYALKKTATDNSNSFSANVLQAAERSFYVDDMLHSVASEAEAVEVATGMMELCKKGGFNLTKWMSNSKAVLEVLPGEKLAKCIQNLDIRQSTLPNERALGLEWNTDEDVFRIRVKTKDPVLTKRGLLSYISSVYDPLGFVCPYVLKAKLLFQEETRRKTDWDEDLQETTIKEFERWLSELPLLTKLSIKRHMLPVVLHKNLVTLQLHHFADASTKAYGTASYIRAEDNNGNVHISFIFGKSRLAPIKAVTVPRLELMAAVVAVNIDEMLKRELNVAVTSFFWSDSMAVLGYIRNAEKKFDVFVNNRLSRIHELTESHQWRYVPTNINPADDASRGLKSTDISRRWLKGPEFLALKQEDWPPEPTKLDDVCCANIVADEVLPVKVERKIPESIINLMARYSSYYKQRRAVAWLLKFIDFIKQKRKLSIEERNISVTDLQNAEKAIIRCEQRRAYGEEITHLKKQRCVPKNSSLYKLEPYIDDNGVIRIGGRLKHASPDVAKNQVLLPPNCQTATNIVRELHAVHTKHAGAEYVLSLLRQKFWLPKARSRIRLLLHKCIVCKILFATPKNQRMADLPPDRLAAHTRPFANTGVDCFGPFLVKRGRSQEKRYGCIFTCLVTRAIHIEVLSSLEADSFINGIMRFASRRGFPDMIRSDNGTNFVGGARELGSSIAAWNEKVHESMLRKDVKWIFNPPAASHMGGVWERQIRSIRRILCALMRGMVLDDERLSTFMCEAEFIVNNRPITRNSSDPCDDTPLTPNHLLQMPGGITAPPGRFSMRDIYNKRWRHVQYLAERFWKRWSREYIVSIQQRQKWLKEQRCLQVNDIVLVCDETSPRNFWPLGRVIEVTKGRDNLVRSATVKTRNSTLKRPVNKLCLLEAST